MNIFSPKVGGHPFFLDDLILLQNSYSEALAGLVGYLSPTGSSIISGVIIDTSGASVTYTAGFVAINGEIFKVIAGSFTNSFNPADRIYFLPVQTVLPPSPDTYEDQSLKNVHFQRQAIVKYYNSSTDSGGAFYPATCRADAGDIRDWVPPPGTVIGDFFDGTGMGINSKIGWAICNGVAGRPDLRGMTTACATNVPNAGSPALNGILNGVTSSPGDVAGITLRQFVQANLPNISFTVLDGGHDHTSWAKGPIAGPGGPYFVSGGNQAWSNGGSDFFGRSTSPDVSIRTSTNNSNITVSSGGSGVGVDTRQPTFYTYKIIKLN